MAGNINQLVKSCPNIEEVYFVDPPFPPPYSDYDFLSLIRFRQLKMLSFRRISMPFGSHDLIKVSLIFRNRLITNVYYTLYNTLFGFQYCLL